MAGRIDEFSPVLPPLGAGQVPKWRISGAKWQVNFMFTGRFAGDNTRGTRLPTT